MKITLTCFGITKEIIGQFSYTIELPDGATVADLKQTLTTQFPALHRLTSLRIARNEAYAQDADILVSTDEIVLIPPVSGG